MQRNWIVCATLLLTACQAIVVSYNDVPKASQSDNDLAKQVQEPSNGNGLAYIVHKEEIATNQTLILIDGIPRGVLSSGTFLVVELSPGAHKISGKRFNDTIWVGKPSGDSWLYYFYSASSVLTNEAKLIQVMSDETLRYKTSKLPSPLTKDFGVGLTSGAEDEVDLSTIKWKRYLKETEGYFVKGFDADLDIMPNEVSFLLFSDRTFYKNPIPVTELAKEEGKALIQSYFLTADIRENNEEWVWSGHGPLPGWTGNIIIPGMPGNGSLCEEGDVFVADGNNPFSKDDLELWACADPD